MKIIDLLNKIANGEDMPKKIKWGVHSYTWFVYDYKALDELGKPEMRSQIGWVSLNDEVEILDDEGEEKSKEPIKLYGLEMLDEDMSHETAIAKQRYNNGRIRTKINEIIDYLEKQRKGE